jgi:hypothetical protein
MRPAFQASGRAWNGSSTLGLIRPSSFGATLAGTPWRRLWRAELLRKKILIALAATASVLGLCAAPALAAPSAGQPQPVTPGCAWPWVTNLDTLVTIPETNYSNPDVQSAYWIMDYMVQAGLRITLSGRYPDSRYMSFEVYAADGAQFTANGVGSTLTDYQIAPDPGSVNPWQHRARPGGRYTVTLRSDAAPGQVNTLPLAPTGTPDGTLGLLFLRVYVPAHDDPWRVPLPAVTFSLGGASERLSTCAPDTTPPPPAISPPSGTSSPPPTGTPGEFLPFSRPPVGIHTSDADTAYLEGGVIPPAGGDVLVIRGKAPTAPRGMSPSPWPLPGEDMQYWSLCVDVDLATTPVVVNTLRNGQTDYGCRYDGQTALDRSGYYTYVVGTESQRAVIDRIRGATFVPFSATYPTTAHVLFFRNMVASPGFAEAIQNVPVNQSNESPAAEEAAAEAVMGPYYPQMAVCPLAVLAQEGPGACPPA